MYANVELTDVISAGTLLTWVGEEENTTITCEKEGNHCHGVPRKEKMDWSYQEPVLKRVFDCRCLVFVFNPSLVQWQRRQHFVVNESTTSCG